MYTKEVIGKALEEQRTGLKNNDKTIDNLKFTGWPSNISGISENLKQMIGRVVRVNEESGLTQNTKAIHSIEITKPQLCQKM